MAASRMKAAALFLGAFLAAASPVPADAVEYAGRLFRDPFEQMTDGDEMAKRPREPQGRLLLKGVFWSSGKPQALINDQIVRVGDRVAEAEVLDIRKDGVKMRDGDNEIFLKFKRGSS